MLRPLGREEIERPARAAGRQDGGTLQCRFILVLPAKTSLRTPNVSFD